MAYPYETRINVDVWSVGEGSGAPSASGRYSIGSAHFSGSRQSRREDMSDLQSARVPKIPLVKKIIAQFIILFCLRLVKLILSRDGVVFYSYRGVWEDETT
jgi:hypothetical protein